MLLLRRIMGLVTLNAHHKSDTQKPGDKDSNCRRREDLGAHLGDEKGEELLVTGSKTKSLCTRQKPRNII